jgi:hypothetical protein
MNDEWDFLKLNTSLESVSVNGQWIKTGTRVRIKPRNRADIMDMVLADKIAVIEAIEQDVEDRIYLALVIEDDPGKDLGMARQPGHRFFYSVDEVELLREGDNE